MNFIRTYKNWEPVYNDLREEQASSEAIVVGCSYGHPSDVTLILIQEIARITAVIIECKLTTFLYPISWETKIHFIDLVLHDKMQLKAS